MLANSMFPIGQNLDYMTARPTPPTSSALNNTGKNLIQNSEDGNYDQIVKDSMSFMKTAPIPQKRGAANPGFPALGMVNTSGLPPLNTNVSSPIATPGAGPPLSTMTPTGAGPHNLHFTQFPRMLPAANPADQNPPCNTLYVGNLPMNTSEDELKALFSRQRGYKRLSFRTKNNGPMCFVEFEDVAFATRALNELYGRGLSNSVKGGIRLSFSKNPLGVRNQGSVPGVSSPITPGGTGFSSIGAPPGLGFPGQSAVSTPTGTLPPQLPGVASVMSPLSNSAGSAQLPVGSGLQSPGTIGMGMSSLGGLNNGLNSSLNGSFNDAGSVTSMGSRTNSNMDLHGLLKKTQGINLGGGNSDRASAVGPIGSPAGAVGSVGGELGRGFGGGLGSGHSTPGIGAVGSGIPNFLVGK